MKQAEEEIEIAFANWEIGHEEAGKQLEERCGYTPKETEEIILGWCEDRTLSRRDGGGTPFCTNARLPGWVGYETYFGTANTLIIEYDNREQTYPMAQLMMIFYD